MQQIIGRDLVSEWMRCGVGILDHEDVLSAHCLATSVTDDSTTANMCPLSMTPTIGGNVLRVGPWTLSPSTTTRGSTTELC